MRKKSGFVRWNLFLVKMLWRLKNVDVTTNDLEEYINLVDEAAAGIEIYDYNFKGRSVGKLLSNCIAHYRKAIYASNFSFLILRNFHNHLTFSSYQSDQSAVINIKARPCTSKHIISQGRLRWLLPTFSNEVFLIKICRLFL